MPKKILVVEDSDDTRVMMVTYLESAGHEVLVARDGLEAIEQAASHCLDIVLMDRRDRIPRHSRIGHRGRMRGSRRKAGGPV